MRSPARPPLADPNAFRSGRGWARVAHHATRALPLLVVATGLLLNAGGCSGKKSSPTQPPPGPTAPEPSTPQGVINLFEFSWDNRSIDNYKRVFTADFEFRFAPADTSGNPYIATPWNRTDEIAAGQHLFATAHSVALTLDNPLLVQPDTRPGKDATVHKFIHTTVLLSVADSTDAVTDVTGAADFYVVRGDSADLTGLTLPKDASHWYIDRWDDLTYQGPGPYARGRTTPAVALPARRFSWGSVKRSYR